MNRPLSLGLAMLAGVALGAMAIKGLNAQTNPPTYVVIDISAVTDPERFNAVLTANSEASTAELGALGGHYVIRTNTTTVLDGTPPQRLVVAAFESPEKAKAWYESPKSKEITAVRVKTAKSSAFIVEGSVN